MGLGFAAQGNLALTDQLPDSRRAVWGRGFFYHSCFAKKIAGLAAANSLMRRSYAQHAVMLHTGTDRSKICL